MPCYSQLVGALVPWLGWLFSFTRLSPDVHKEERHCKHISSPFGLCTERLVHSSSRWALAYAAPGYPRVSPWKWPLLMLGGNIWLSHTLQEFWWLWLPPNTPRCLNTRNEEQIDTRIARACKHIHTIKLNSVHGLIFQKREKGGLLANQSQTGVHLS